jgi:microcystin-dependent protein
MPTGIPISPLPILAPVGSIAAWLKSHANTPALPSGWVECNGQTLSDADSVYNGQTIPNLNGENRFLRGNSSSGGTGGEDSHLLTLSEMPSHGHDIPFNDGGAGGTDTYLLGGTSDNADPILTASPVGGGQAHENRPPFYNVVWIMRVK